VRAGIIVRAQRVSSGNARPLGFTVRLLVRRQLLFIAVIAFVAGAAAEPPPSGPFESLDWPASMRKEPTKGITLGAFRIEFEKTTLSEVQHAVKVGTIEQRGDAAEHILWLCYSITRSEGSERVWIISSGEMGGSEHAITEVAAQRRNSGNATSDCPSLPRAMQPASMDERVWLGSTEAELDRDFGPPSHSEGMWRSYYFQIDVPGEDCVEINSLTIKLEQGRVAALNAGQITSC
jgi:hypothetical protein